MHRQSVRTAKQHKETFPTWLAEYVRHRDFMQLNTVLCYRAQVSNIPTEGDDAVLTELRVLADKPYRTVTRYSSYLVNGYKFCTKTYGLHKATMNYGVPVNGSEREGNKETTFYGMITDIIELNYSDKGSVVLFKCEWASTARKGTMVDEYGIKLVNFNQLRDTGEHPLEERFIHA